MMLIDVKYFHYIVKKFQCCRDAQLALAQSDGDQYSWGQRMEMLSGTETFSFSNYRNLGFPLLSSHFIIPLGTIATVFHLSVDTIFCAIWLPYNTNNISNKLLWFISVTSETHNVFLFFSLKSITSWPMKQNSQLHYKNLEKKPHLLPKVQDARFLAALSLYNRSKDKLTLKRTCIWKCS